MAKSPHHRRKPWRPDPPRRYNLGNTVRTEKDIAFWEKICSFAGHQAVPVLIRHIRADESVEIRRDGYLRCVTCGRW